jgi:hypothetical protein
MRLAIPVPRRRLSQCAPEHRIFDSLDLAGRSELAIIAKS